MKKHLVLFLSLAATIMMASCTKDDANYYVRYEAEACNPYPGYLLLGVNTENGLQTIEVSRNVFSETYGPVQKGFHAAIYISSVRATSASIYVSKGEEPFVLKATGQTSAEYVIDY